MKKTIAVCAALALAGIGAFVALRQEAAEPPEAGSGDSLPARVGKASGAGPSARRPGRLGPRKPDARRAKAGPSVAAPAANGLSGADRRLAEGVQAALDDEDVEAVRRLAVEALEWFGEKALGDLTPFLADADGDVKEAAMGAVEQALAQMEDERAKIAYVEAVASVPGACTADGLEMLAGQLRGVDDEAAAVAAAARVIASGADPAAVAAMREVYEFLTGEAYTTPEAAERWRAEKAAEGE